jgi:nicotinamidase-related amidase
MSNQLRVNRNDSLAVIIDVQEKLFPLIYEHDQLAKNIIILIKGLKTLDIPMLVTQQYTKGLGTTVSPIHEALGNYEHVEKMAFSCCGDDKFTLELNTKNKKTVIVAGIECHVCVLQTTLDLLERGFRPVVIEDCVSSRKLNDKLIAIERMRNAGAVISTYESILFELTQVSGTEEFKSIVKLVK